MDLDLDAPFTLAVSRSRPAGWQLARGRERFHVEVRAEGAVLRFYAACRQRDVDALPWYEAEGLRVERKALVAFVQAALACPGVALARWDDADTVEPRLRAPGEIPPAAAAPGVKLGHAWRWRALLAPVTVIGVVVCAFGFAGTTLFATIGLSWRPWGGLLSGLLVASISLIGGAPKGGNFDAADAWMRTAAWGFVFLPLYGGAYQLLQPLLTMSEPVADEVLDRGGSVTRDFYRFVDARVAVEAKRSNGHLSIAPLVPRSWESGEPVVFWAECSGEGLQVCEEAWNAPTGVLEATVQTPSRHGNQLGPSAEGVIPGGDRFYAFHVEGADTTVFWMWLRRSLSFAGLAVWAWLWMAFGAGWAAAAAERAARAEQIRSQRWR